MKIFDEIANAILDTRKEILGSENVDEERESFVVKLMPCSFPTHWGFEIINTFSIILKGLLSTKDAAGLVNIIQTDSPGGGNVFDHNFFLFSIPKRLWMSTLGNPAIGVFSFVGASTSGYPGSGPQIHAEINKIIKESSDEVAFRRVRLTSAEHEELQNAFRKHGPILVSVYPMNEIE